MAKYIPPHKRNNSYVERKRYEPKKQPVNHKIIKELLPIKPVEKVFPPVIVPLPIAKDKSQYNIAIIAGLLWQPCEPLEISSEYIVKPLFTESQLFKELAAIREKSAKKADEAEFKEWSEHYNNDLEIMYDECVDDKLCITFQQFIETAYICTTTVYDRNKFKRSRPLV